MTLLTFDKSWKCFSVISYFVGSNYLRAVSCPVSACGIKCSWHSTTSLPMRPSLIASSTTCDSDYDSYNSKPQRIIYQAACTIYELLHILRAVPRVDCVALSRKAVSKCTGTRAQLTVVIRHGNNYMCHG